MQRANLAVLLVITLVAGIAAGTVFGRTQPIEPSRGVAGRNQTATAFYDALNQALAGGGTDALAGLLAPGFLDHDASFGEPQTAEEFLERLRTLGQSDVSQLLAVESIEASGSSLMVQVSHAEFASRELAGVVIDHHAAPPSFDVLRLAGERVIERWTNGIKGIEAHELEAITIQSPGRVDLAMSLMRIHLPAGVFHQWQAAGPGFLLLESGVAKVQETHRDGGEATSELEPGSAIPVSASDRLELRSTEGAPVTALVYAVIRRSATETLLPRNSGNTPPAGLEQPILWSGPVPQIMEAGRVHDVGTLMVPAGEEIRLTAPAGTELLFAIDSGTVSIAAPERTIQVLGDDLWPANHDDIVQIDGSRGAVVSPEEATLTLRNTAGRAVRVLLITIEPESNRASSFGQALGTGISPAPCASMDGAARCGFGQRRRSW
jgi:hypothetical protein